MFPTDSPLRELPPPTIIHKRLGLLYRELALLRRLLRLSQAARDERLVAGTDGHVAPQNQGESHPDPPQYLRAVWAAAQQKPLPAAAPRYYLDGMRRLVALCCECQEAAGDGTWFLACRDAAALIGGVDFRAVSRWLKRLEQDGVLTRIAKGSRAKRKANEYRYTA